MRTETSRELTLKDRSAIYGGFHLYILRRSDMPAAATAAEKMDAIYRRQRFIYDATRRYYLFGRDRLIGSLKPPLGGLGA